MLLAVVNGLFEMVGVASILPFLAVLSDPGRIESNAAAPCDLRELGFAIAEGFLTFLGLAVLGLVLFSLCLRLVSTYVISRFANMRAYSLSEQLIENYLRQPYIWFLTATAPSSARPC